MRTDNSEYFSCETEGKALLVSMFDGKTHEIDSEHIFVIGRETAGDNCTVQIDDKIVSRKHAQIIFDGAFAVVDLKSKNGTYLNGDRISPGQKHYLKEGDIIEFSKIKYRFESFSKAMNFAFGSYECVFMNIEDKLKLCIDIKDKELISYQEKMMEMNDCEGLLKMTVMKTADGSQLFYDVCGMETLGTAIKKGMITKARCMEVLKSIIKIISNSRKYLLNENNFVILPETVFINSLTGEINLIYMPVDAENSSNCSNLKKLIYCFLNTQNEEIKRFAMDAINILNDEKEYIERFSGFLRQNEEVTETDILSEEKHDIAYESEKTEQKIFFRMINGKMLRIIAIQCAMLILAGTILFAGFLKTVDFIGFAIILLATDIWLLRSLKLV